MLSHYTILYSQLSVKNTWIIIKNVNNEKTLVEHDVSNELIKYLGVRLVA